MIHGIPTYDIIATAYLIVGIALAVYLFVAHKKKRADAADRLVNEQEKK